MLPKWCCVLLRASYLEAYKVHQLVKMLSGFPTDARIFSYFNNGKLNLIKNYMSCSHLYKQHSSHPNKSYWIWDIEWNFKASRCREETEVRRGKVTCPMLVSKARVYSVSDLPPPPTPARPLYLRSKAQQRRSLPIGHQRTLFFERRNLLPPLLATLYYNSPRSPIQTPDLFTLKHYPCPNWKWLSCFIIEMGYLTPWLSQQTHLSLLDAYSLEPAKEWDKEATPRHAGCTPQRCLCIICEPKSNDFFFPPG